MLLRLTGSTHVHRHASVRAREEVETVNMRRIEEFKSTKVHTVDRNRRQTVLIARAFYARFLHENKRQWSRKHCYQRANELANRDKTERRGAARSTTNRLTNILAA